MRAFAAQLRSGGFVTRARVRLWAGAVIAAMAVSILFLLATAHGASDYAGRPLGTDFSNVYAAGKAALAGQAAAPFDIAHQQVMEQAILGPNTPIYGWHYPPFFLLAAAVLATVPYLAALALWLVATLALYLFAMRLLLKSGAAPGLLKDTTWLLAVLGFPAVLVNLLHGQNGFLTAALMALGLALLERKPILSGIAFGLLCYKPQYFAVIPLVLFASGNRRALLASLGTIAIAAITVTAIFGVAIWPAFLDGAHFTRTVVLEQGSTGFEKMQSVFAAVRLWGGSIALAYVAQAASAVIALMTAWRVWRHDTSPAMRGAVLCAALLLITPYSLDYDLMLLAPAIALLAGQGLRDGFANWEITLLVTLWALPGFARPLAQHLHLPLAVPLLFALLWFSARHAREHRFSPLKSASW